MNMHARRSSNHLPRRLILAPLMVLGFMIAAGLARETAETDRLPASRGGQDLVGQKMPPLQFERWARGEPARDRPAKLTLYRWWTDGCPFCEKSLPAIESLRNQYELRGLRVVAVYHPKPPREVTDKRVLKAADAIGYGGAVAIDQDWSELKRAYLDTGDRRATSVSFLVDAEGEIHFVHPGTQFFPSDDPNEAQENEDFQLLERAIDRLLPPEKK